MERIDKQSGDFLLFLNIVTLVGIGLSVLFSASYFHSERLYNDSFYLFKRQSIGIAMGIIAALIVFRVPPDAIKKSTPYFLLLSLGLSLLTFVPGIGTPILGARRWILFFGQTFEPSELVKFSLVLYLSTLFSKKQDRINDPINSILPPMIIVILFVALIYFQNDFSTAFLILLIALIMFFIAKVKLRYFFMLFLVVIPLGGLLLFTKAHRVKRLISFLNPLADPTGSGFQVIAAQTALTGGGFWGRGPGKGLKKLGALPEAHSDFIYAVVGEETGFLGAVFVVMLFLFFAWRGYSIALKSEDPFTHYLAFGITTIIFIQGLLNITVVIGLVPATGIPLPFFSHGGSSMLVTLFMCGVLLNLSRFSAARRRVYV